MNLRVSLLFSNSSVRGSEDELSKLSSSLRTIIIAWSVDIEWTLAWNGSNVKVQWKSAHIWAIAHILAFAHYPHFALCSQGKRYSTDMNLFLIQLHFPLDSILVLRP